MSGNAGDDNRGNVGEPEQEIPPQDPQARENLGAPVTPPADVDVGAQPVQEIRFGEYPEQDEHSGRGHRSGGRDLRSAARAAAASRRMEPYAVRPEPEEEEQPAFRPRSGDVSLTHAEARALRPGPRRGAARLRAAQREAQRAAQRGAYRPRTPPGITSKPNSSESSESSRDSEETNLTSSGRLLLQMAQGFAPIGHQGQVAQGSGTASGSAPQGQEQAAQGSSNAPGAASAEQPRNVSPVSSDPVSSDPVSSDDESDDL